MWTEACDASRKIPFLNHVDNINYNYNDKLLPFGFRPFPMYFERHY